jgi:hypothetical protein
MLIFPMDKTTPWSPAFYVMIFGQM